MRVLLSFHYYRDKALDQVLAGYPTTPDVFADSGAFSASTVGAEVRLEDYAAWLTQWDPLLRVKANLDVIGDPAQSERNMGRLEDLGHQVLPVFHAGEPMEYLERWCRRYPYIALGGMVGSRGPKLLRWVVQCLLVGREHGTRFHGFGLTAQDVVARVPLYSMDSSSWGAGHRHGILMLWDEPRLRWVQVKWRYRDQVIRDRDVLREYGLDPAWLLANPRWGRSAEGKDTHTMRRERAAIIAANVDAWVRWERWVQRRHGPQPAPAGLEGDGPRLYFAEADPRNLRCAARVAAGEQEVEW